ncbi:hypothetical protein [Phytoactinopolyspora halotolerans]|uniref:Uncharacterized protein n=1 Tax=Phytoactinopolyspora halotolerans TaxID=1981512 RepID=A0A6L9S486_9ACTN|nr:hypothetical protein [Phytoactinopolyspora halotolerans]NED99463.1 hypothetical protein [Phytoactinopolyspora halotolerans]
MPSSRFSMVTAALAGVLALASASGAWLLAGGIAIVQVVFALGAIRSSGVASARPAAWLGLVVGAGALGWTLVDETSTLTPVAAILGPAVLAAFITQLLRRDGRPRLNAALSLTVVSCVLTVLPVMWLSLRATSEGVHVVGLALLGVGAVGVTEALPISRAVRRVLGVLVASIAAAVLVVAVEGIDDAVPAVSAVVLAAFAGVMAAVAYAIEDRLAGEAGAVPDHVLVTVPERTPATGGGADETATLGDPAAGSPAGSPAGSGEPVTESRVRQEALVPLRIAAPFIAAAPAAYVLGQLLVG